MSFIQVFKENLSFAENLIDVRPGDITTIGYNDTVPIEVLGVDVCKALSVTDFLVREFFPRLMPGALVLQQDFIHEFHPYIHISMQRLEEFFEPYVEFKWGGTVAFKTRKLITREVIQKRLGPDSSWYDDAQTNVSLLRRLIDDSLYDEESVGVLNSISDILSTPRGYGESENYFQ